MDKAFFGFFIFGIFTVLLALGAGLLAISGRIGAGQSALGFLLILFGMALALMLGSLAFIRAREQKRNQKG